MKKKTRKKFKHLDQSDRDRIEALLRAGHQQQEIAVILQVDKGTISREITKHQRKDGHYESGVANHKARIARSGSKYQGMKVEEYPIIKQMVIAGLEAKQSPDAIAGRMKEEEVSPTISTRAIYRWLYSRYGQAWCHLLCTRRYKRRRQTGKPLREMLPGITSLAKRPKRGIHAEIDLFVSSKESQSSRSGAVMVIPTVGLIVGTMIENKKPAVMARAVRMMKSHVLIDDVTMDRGIENRNFKDFGVPAYACDPHSPWQKPHVEQSIGLLRRWFIKKKTDLRTVREEDLQQYLHILNSKWRKSLGYQSAYEVAIKHGILKTKIPLRGANGINQLVAFQVTI